MSIDVRQVSHPEAVKRFDTQELRRHFLIESLFVPGAVTLTYSHLERLIVGGAQPAGEPLVLPTPGAVGTDSFLKRRELGIINIGGPGRVSVGGASHELGARDALYVGMGAGEVTFESRDPGKPAKFYLVSTPAHAAYDTVRIPNDKAEPDRTRRPVDVEPADDLPVHHPRHLRVLPARHGLDPARARQHVEHHAVPRARSPLRGLRVFRPGRDPRG